MQPPCQRFKDSYLSLKISKNGVIEAFEVGKNEVGKNEALSGQPNLISGTDWERSLNQAWAF